MANRKSPVFNITRLQHTGHTCLQIAGVKCRLLLTFIDSERTIMHSSYTNRRGVKKSLQMINTPSAIQLSKNLSHHLHSVSSQVVFTTCSPRTVNFHTPAILLPNIFTLWKTVLIPKSNSEMLHAAHMVVSNYSLSSRHIEYVQHIYNNIMHHSTR